MAWNLTLNHTTYLITYQSVTSIDLLIDKFVSFISSRSTPIPQMSVITRY
jgi:hypothetical protein